MGIILDQLSELTLTRSVTTFTQELADSLLKPSTLSGVNVSDAVGGTLSVALQKNTRQFRSQLVFTIVDLADAFTLTLDGTAVVHTPAEPTIALTMQSIVDFVNANATFKLIVVASFDGQTIYLDNIADSRHTTVITSTGTSDMDFQEDATSLDIRVWGKVKGRSWVQINDGFFNVTSLGFIETFSINTLERIYIQVENVDAETNATKAMAEIFFGAGERE